MKIWIIDDDPGYRRNLRMSLEMEEDITVGRVFPSCIECFDALIVETPPDAVLMDLGLPGMCGIEGIQKMAQIYPDVAVMVLTVFKEKKKVQAALEAGAAGYLLKESDGREIANGLREVLDDSTDLTPVCV